jgi:quinolinate synthase
MVEKKIEDKIKSLKELKNALILAHNYQIPEIQDIADFVGDSLDLALKATKTDAKNIIFCGVDFMAESAKILNPEKNVIIPDVDAKCPMAEMVDSESLSFMKKEHSDAEVVTYINTTADVKAISDICCTSSNGIKIVKSRKSKKIIFVPDRNLGLYIQRFTPKHEMIIWQGVCPTHHKISKENILKIKNKHPESKILVHPECQPDVIDIADYVFSTNGMINHVKQSKEKEFIIGTEKGICHRLEKENPNKTFYPIESAICPNMKKISLKKVLNSLESLEPKVELPEKILNEAKLPLQKMMNIGRGD